MKATIEKQVFKHGEQLNAIFNTGIDPVTLCRKLRRIEREAHHAATCLCNTNTLHLLELNRFTGYDVQQATEEEQYTFFDKIKNKLVKILGEKSIEAIYINLDPRGYALKKKNDYMEAHKLELHRDWGGYGILAPDFTAIK